MKQVVSRGRLGINLNGELSEFFRTFKGLRQGDPLSPLLFNILVDALGTILTKAKDAGMIRGLIPELGGKGAHTPSVC
jgi:hypothetical protein